MEDPKIDVARDVARRFSAGDMDGLGTHFDPDAVLFPPRGWPERGPMRGREAIVRQFTRLAEDYTSQRSGVAALATEGEWILGRNTWDARARHSGIESALELWFATRFEDGLIVELHYCWSRDEAVRAAGTDG